MSSDDSSNLMGDDGEGLLFDEDVDLELSQEITIEVPNSMDQVRLDRIISTYTSSSRSVVERAIDDGEVSLNGKVVNHKSQRVNEGDLISVKRELLVEAISHEVKGEGGISFGVIYEDDDILVIDKPAELVVHPGVKNSTGTLINGIVGRFPEVAEVGNPLRPGVVHRIDKGTSGLLVIARSQVAYDSLSRQMAEHSSRRRYIALVSGSLTPDSAVIDGPIAKSLRQIGLMRIAPSGKPSRTRYQKLGEGYFRSELVSSASFELETGRTHQIRVHISNYGYPIVGDVAYGSSFDLGERVFLHAFALELDHPITGERIEFHAPLPPDLVALEAEMDQGLVDSLGPFH
ncbi:MAG: RluA family pseudouridine synthase [Actinomycetota bacterium]|nr:RluA family pseudouridine synthase [Actinomycetota bacterium]